MMKKIFLFAFAAAAFVFAGCSNDDGHPTVPGNVSGVTLNQFNVSLLPGETVQLTATVTPADATDAVVWQSDNKAVATVSTAGLVEALIPGRATVTVTCGGFSASCDVLVAGTQITFDDAELGAAGYLWGKPQATVLTADSPADQIVSFGEGSALFFGTLYTDAGASFTSFYTDWLGKKGPGNDMWGGFAISGIHNVNTFRSDIPNQMSVHTTENDIPNQFAVGYCIVSEPGQDFSAYVPTVEFTEAVSMMSVQVANADLTYLYLTGAADSGGAYSDFSVTVTGFNGDTQTGTVSAPLAADSEVVSDWTTVDLSALGTVTKLTFSVVCSDNMAPTYFCIDNLTYNRLAAN